MNIRDISQAIDAQNYRITHHADVEAQNDDLNLEGIFYSVRHGEVIENYPEDRPYPSCLIYGTNADGAPIHSVWAYAGVNQQAILVPVYRPDPMRWINWRERRT